MTTVKFSKILIYQMNIRKLNFTLVSQRHLNITKAERSSAGVRRNYTGISRQQAWEGTPGVSRQQAWEGTTGISRPPGVGGNS